MRLLQNIMTKNLAYIENRWIIPRRIVWHSTGANNPYLRRYVGPDDGLLGVNKRTRRWASRCEQVQELLEQAIRGDEAQDCASWRDRQARR